MLVGRSPSDRHDRPTSYDNNQQADSTHEVDPLGDYLSRDHGNPSASRLVQEVASNAIINSLASEWWSSNMSQIVLNNLIEHLIPLLVLGCEKIIKEADEHHLIETTLPDRSFNPINRLASFLMRNNPKYMHYSSLSPYRYAMNSMLNQNKIQVLKVFGEEETSLRKILKERQQERYQQDQTHGQADEKRKDLLKSAFLEWNVPERGWIETKLVNNMIEQFNEIQSIAKLDLPTFQSHRLHLGTFVEGFLRALHGQSEKNFETIIDIYRRCAQTYLDIVHEHELDLLIQHLFVTLDEKQSGYLLRPNVRKILQTFYNALDDQIKANVNQPDQWPVVKPSSFKRGKEENSRPPTPVVVNEDVPATRQPEQATTEQQPPPPTPPPPPAAPVSSDDSEQKEQTVSPSNQETAEEKTDERIETPKNLTIDLKDPNAYESRFRYIKDKKPIYNLERFEISEQREQSTPYDERLIDKVQFSSLLTAFVGMNKDEKIVSGLIDYFRSNYTETDDEKIGKKTLVKQRNDNVQRRAQTDGLFDKMDTTCTGLIKFEPIADALKQYKESTLLEQIEPILQAYEDHPTVSSTQFFDLLISIHQTLNDTSGNNNNETFDELLKYVDNRLINSNSSDRLRIDMRHQWLKHLRTIPFRTMGRLYKEIMDLLQKDADTFGNQKDLSIYIALLERDTNQTRNRLRYIATTNDQTDLILGKTLQRGQGISFQVLDSGKSAYIAQTKNSSRIYFFDPTKRDQPGSLVLVPLKRWQRKFSSGLLGIDTIRDRKEKAFVPHEIQFYEGVAGVLSETLTFIDFDTSMRKIVERFCFWLKRRCPNISTVDYYTYEPISINNSKERLLKRVLTYKDYYVIAIDESVPIDSREQVFKYHLEHAAIACQSMITSFLGETHLVQTIRGRDNYCFALLDANIGQQSALPDEQKQALMALYRYMYFAVDELEEELIDDMPHRYLSAEQQYDESRIDFLLDRIWYMDICEMIEQLSQENIQEFISTKSKWNEQIKQLNTVISRITTKKDLHPSDYAKNVFPAMAKYDPTTKDNDNKEFWNRAEQCLNAMDRTQIPSDITKIMYDWLNLAFALYKLVQIQEGV